MSSQAPPVQSEATSEPRARGEVRATFARSGPRTHAARVYETGGLRLRFPTSGEVCEAVLVNTGGGMAGGDHLSSDFTLGDDAAAIIATQSAEKVYRADGRPCRVDVTLRLGAGASLVWMPQETILFEGAALERRLEVDLPASASLLAVEMLYFGRLAMGETRIDAAIRDTWRVRRDGRLLFAENFGMAHAGEALDRPAVGNGARAVATMVLVAPDSAARLDGTRATLDAASAAEGAWLEAGASAYDGMMIARALSPSPSRLRGAIVALTSHLRGVAPPRVWL
jgi:urease accessory protein